MKIKEMSKETLDKMSLDELKDLRRDIAEKREAHPNSMSKNMLALDEAYLDVDSEIQERTSKTTTREEMLSLHDGDRFYINGNEYIADGDTHYSGDSSYDGHIVYDTDGEEWFEEDFEQ